MESLFLRKKGNILTENLIFIILNLVFLTILILFVFSKTGSAAVLEEKYAKEIALMIDSSESLMVINLEMLDAVEIAREEGIKEEDAVSILGNVVTVRLHEGPGYSYSFFNDVNVVSNFVDRKTGNYTFFISERK